MTDIVVYGEAQLVELLGAVIDADGSPRIARRRLKDQGQDIAEGQLRSIVRDHQSMYLALAAEKARTQEDAIAQSLREVAGLSTKVNKAFLESLADQIDEKGIDGLDSDLKRQLPQTVQALSKVMQVSVDKLLTITGRPQDGGAGDPLEAARTLIDLGILKPRERADIDSTATEG